MKQFFIYIILFISTASTTHAQISKGLVLTGVSLGISGSQNESSANPPNESSYFDVSPSVGFMVKDNRMLGFQLTYGNHRSENENQKVDADNYGAAIFIRRYAPLGKRFFLYGQAGAAYNLMDREDTQANRRDLKRESAVVLNLSPGVACALTQRFHLEAGIGNLLELGYKWDNTRTVSATSEYETKGSGFNFSANANPRSQLYIGFRIGLGK